jgi:hypothetical protein
MDFNTTIDIIIKDLREAREIIDDLKHYSGVPRIQVELAKSKCKSAEEIMALLKTMRQENGIEKKTGVDGIEGVEGVERVEEVVDNTKEEIKIPEGKADNTARKKLKGKPPETNIVADQFSGLSNIFNEQLGNSTTGEGISAVIKARPVNNLTEAIGINDKFLFVREIFNGDQLSYNEAITKLNKVDNLSDAKAVIMSYTGDGDENEAVKQLLDLVKRKLPSDE